MLTADEIEDVLGAFPNADVSIIERIMYFGGWQSYEECGGIFVFEGIDGSIQIAEYGTSVFSSEPTVFAPRDISPEEAEKEINDMRASLETFDWPEY